MNLKVGDLVGYRYPAPQQDEYWIGFVKNIEYCLPGTTRDVTSETGFLRLGFVQVVWINGEFAGMEDFIGSSMLESLSEL
jgi:hypothetical protein|tara:strand:- start:9992 stop:10231 length:240 start_codon:yes stop_codon:yes gene_type:complete